ncbi:radical SAM/CxCxxxxC motif protein YfkAB [Risungbinella massiliensis]|uniref:radical SAM/CxCxxxxC motif protein YfkAB n=1 Tax=Risungbinella massiliensis TaxID=1329796 RepID=UPI0005CB9B0C|nr:radical SAM/CxCxxxxC motif protein YfkAB [Risungbinella massiliensis]
MITEKKQITPQFDPWDVWDTRKEKGRYELTSVEFTVTQLCNLRCEHCAVGEMLQDREEAPLSIDLLLQRLDEIETLQTISITGGEPIVNPKIVRDVIKPLLRYCRDRGIYTQLNSNLTLPLSRYEDWIEDLDVLHISYNYRNEEDFHRIVFGRAKGEVSLPTAEKLYQQMLDNAKSMTKNGVFVSAESLLSPFTAPNIGQMHRTIANMGCQRHEVHPLYTSDFANGMEVLSLAQYRDTIYRLLQNRDPEVWILLGTLPFYPCSHHPADRDLWLQLHQEPNLTVRQDPDGRNRLNVNIFTGEVIVTDFGDVPPLGNIQMNTLPDIFEKWLQHPVAKATHCYCETARCTGPNILVANTYYADWEFSERSAAVSVNSR